MKKRKKEGIGQQKTHSFWGIYQRVNLSAKDLFAKMIEFIVEQLMRSLSIG
jgi:hypothetical protein